MASVTASKKDTVRNRARRARQARNQVLDCLWKLGAQFWSAADCLRTVHFRERVERRGITYREFLDTWRHGQWMPDADDPNVFIAALGRCRIVVAFRDETPHLVTAKYVAAHLAV